MENPILYVILNGELNMSAGKGAAQAVHAAMLLQDNYEGNFTLSNKRTVIVLEAESAAQIRNLQEYLQGAGLYSQYYIDEGVGLFDTAYSLTALAVEPIDEDDTRRGIFQPFALFSGEHRDTESEACDKTSPAREAIRWLNEVSAGCSEFDGICVVDKTPRFVKKTLKWLRER